MQHTRPCFSNVYMYEYPKSEVTQAQAMQCSGGALRQSPGLPPSLLSCYCNSYSTLGDFHWTVHGPYCARKKHAGDAFERLGLLELSAWLLRAWAFFAWPSGASIKGRLSCSSGAEALLFSPHPSISNQSLALQSTFVFSASLRLTLYSLNTLTTTTT